MTQDEIIEAARDQLESEGPGALSMRRVAERLGVRASSLYEHVANKQALEGALVAEGYDEWTSAARRAGTSLAAVAEAYRAFALAHPHLYRLMTGLDDDRAAQPAIAAMGGDPHAGHALWGFLHGMAISELDGRFPEGSDIDAAWQTGLAVFWRLAHRPL